MGIFLDGNDFFRYHYINIPARPLQKHAHYAGFFMAKISYKKPALSYSQQIALLKSRGLIIKDISKAEQYLKTIGYYRLSGYMYPFLSDVQNHKFKDGTTFDDVINLYKFDRELRLLVFSAIEKIEVAVRTQIVQHYSEDFKTPFWLDDISLFSDKTKHSDILKSIKALLVKSKDIFITHFYQTYSEPMPPAWMTFEIMQMGQLSMIYECLNKSQTHKDIAAYFGIKEAVLVSWLHTLVYVRNISAHHARLWNKKLRIAAKLPMNPTFTWYSASVIKSDSFFVVFCIINYILKIISPRNRFVKKFKHLLRKYKNIDIVAMGFPPNWEKDKFF